MPARRSRRTRGERPEIVPPKSDEEPDEEKSEDDDSKSASEAASGSVRGRRKRAAATGGAGGRRKKKTEDKPTAAPTRRTRRTRGAAKDTEEDKSQSGDSSQEVGDGGSSEDEKESQKASASGEDNASIGEDKAGDDSDGKDKDQDSGSGDNKPAPKKPKKGSKKAPPKKAAPSRRGRPRRGAAKAKEEMSGEDEQADLAPQSDDDSSKVETRPGRRQTRKRKLPDRSAASDGTKSASASTSEDDEGKKAESSDEDHSEASTKQKIEKGTADEEIPPADDAKKKPSHKDDDSKKSEKKVDETSAKDDEKDSKKTSGRSSNDGDSEDVSGDHEKTTSDPNARDKLNEPSTSRRRRKRTRGASPEKDVDMKPPLSPIGEAEEHQSGDNAGAAKTETGEKSDEASQSEGDVQQNNEASTQSDEVIAEKTELPPSITNEDKANADADETSVEEKDAGSNGAKRKHVASDELPDNDDDKQDLDEKPRKRVKREKSDVEVDDTKMEVDEEAQEEMPPSPALDDEEAQPKDVDKAPESTDLQEHPVSEESKPLEHESDDNTKTASGEQPPSEAEEPAQKKASSPLPETAEKDTEESQDKEDVEISEETAQQEASLREKGEKDTPEIQDTGDVKAEQGTKTNDALDSESGQPNEPEKEICASKSKDFNSANAEHSEDMDKNSSESSAAESRPTSIQNKVEASQVQEDTQTDVDKIVEENGIVPHASSDNGSEDVPGDKGDSTTAITTEEPKEAVSEDKGAEAEVPEKPETEGEVTDVPKSTSELDESFTEKRVDPTPLHEEKGAADDSREKMLVEPTSPKASTPNQNGIPEKDKDEAAEAVKGNDEVESQPRLVQDASSTKKDEDGTEQESTALVTTEQGDEENKHDDLMQKHEVTSVSQGDNAPEATPKTEAAKNEHDISPSDSQKEKVDSPQPMEVDTEAEHLPMNKPEDEDGDVETKQEDTPKPSLEKSSAMVIAVIATSLQIPDSARLDIEVDSESGLARSVTEEVERPPPPPPEIVKTAVWKPLSTAKPTRAPEPASLLGFDENKINRVKLALYSLGSRVHRGQGFERLFADYWDAVCLRLSARLSSHTLDRCDIAISAFLVSKKLRKVHNQFIMGIMRRSTRVFARRTDLSSHVPAKWRDRVRVRVIETTGLRKPSSHKIPASFLEKDFLSICDLPHPVPGQPYKEPWQLFDDAVDNVDIHSDQSTAIESVSRCIPGAMVVDPVLRKAAEEKGLESSSSAMWLLTVAVREHTKNVLTGSIAHKKALEKGEVHPKFLHYPNILASNAKNGKHRVDTSVPPPQKGNKKTRISCLDIFSASRGMPAGHIGSLGGAISRLSLEQSLQSAFQSMPPFFPGNDFKEVQSFVATEIFDTAQEQEKAQASSKLVDDPSPAKAGASSPDKPKPETAPKPDDTKQPADTKAQELPKAGAESEKDEKNDDIASQDPLESSTDKSTGQSTQPSEPKPVPPAGRGAKNLRALMARASSETKRDDESGTNTSANDDDKKEESKNMEAKETGETESMEKKEDADTAQPDSGEAKGDEKSSEKSEKPNPDDSADKNQDDPKDEENKSSTNPEEKKDEGEKKRQESSPPKEEKEEDAKDETSASVDESSAAPKGKGVGAKNLAAMRARTTTTQSESDENKDGDKKGDTK